MAQVEQYHAKTLKGLETLLAEELRSLGAERTKELNRGVTFYGGRALLYRVNMASRLALRVLVPIMKFESADTGSLYRKVKHFDWSLYLDNRMTFAINPVVHSPYFRNSHYAALKVKDAIADHFREKTHLRPSVNRKQPDLLINLHISENRVTISLDSSGSSLHRRGYRKGHFDAPLNEVLAAGMILATGWRGEIPLLDPMCGSGTLVIEAALIAAGIPPGIFRKGFGFEHWKDFDRELFEHVVQRLPAEKKVRAPLIARDVDPGAIALTRRQLKQMELDQLIRVEQMDFAASPFMEENITIVMNPPYGERLDPGELGSLYHMIGSTLKHRFPASNAWILSSNRQALGQVGLKPSGKTILYNGSLECVYVNYKLFKGSLKHYLTQKNHP